MDPDLLVFGKYFTSNVRGLPHHYSRANGSEPLPPDKRQFIHPPPPPALPLTSAPTGTRPTTARRGLTTTTTATTTLQSTSQATVVPTTTTTLSSTSPALITDQQTHEQSTAPTTSTSSPAPSFTAPPPPMTDATLGHHSPETTSIFPTTTAQPSTSAPTQHHTTTSSQSATSPLSHHRPCGQHREQHAVPQWHQGPPGRNHTAGGDGGQGVSGEDTLEELGPSWHVAARTLLVAVAICVTVLLSCCCSILLVVSWRAHRRRMGRYRTSWRGRRGSMRLIKYVLVRESSWERTDISVLFTVKCSTNNSRTKTFDRSYILVFAYLII